MLKRYSFSWLTVIDRYIFRECLQSVVSLVGILWLIYLAITYAHLLKQAALGDMPVSTVFSLLMLNSLSTLSVLLPMSAFLAVMLALGRMSADNELTVIHACGVSRKRIIRNIFIFASCTAVIVGGLSLVVVPDILQQQYKIRDEAKLSVDTSGVISGQFKQAKRGTSTFYAQRLNSDRKTMEDVFIHLVQKGKQPVTMRAKQAHFQIDAHTGDQFIVLNDGYRYQGTAGQLNFSITQFKKHRILINRGSQTEIKERQRAVSTSKLLSRATKADIAELQWRVSSIVMTVILCLIALPLTQSGPRKGRFVGFVPAILIYIIYTNLSGINRSWVSSDHIPSSLGWVWVHLIMLLLMSTLYNTKQIQPLFSFIRLSSRSR